MRKILKNAAFIAFVLLIFILQTTLGAKLMLWGVKPDLMPFLAAALGVVAGKTAGAWLGFLGGTLCDLASPFGMGPRMAVCFLAGAVSGELVRKVLRRGFPAAFLLGLAAALSANLLDVLIGAARGLPLPYLLRDAAFAVLYSTFASPLAYFPLRALSRAIPTPEDSLSRGRPSRVTSLRTVRHPKGEDL